MVYTKGKLKGQLTTAEIRKLISAHNKLSKITIPPKSNREDILKLLTDKGFSVNHEQQKLEQIRVEKKDVDLEQAKEITKRKPRAKPLPKPKPKPLPKEDEVRPKEKVGRPRFDPNKIKVITPEKKKLLAIEDQKEKPKRDFKINRSERKKMLGQLIDDTGGRMINLHKVLGMKPSEETPELVKQKCRELKLKFHPDKNNEPDQDKFDLVQKVCKILLDTQEIGKDKPKEEPKVEEKIEKIETPGEMFLRNVLFVIRQYQKGPFENGYVDINDGKRDRTLEVLGSIINKKKTSNFTKPEMKQLEVALRFYKSSAPGRVNPKGIKNFELILMKKDKIK